MLPFKDENEKITKITVLIIPVDECIWIRHGTVYGL